MGLRLISTAVVSTLGLAACTSILGNDFTIREDGPAAGGSGPTTTSTTGTIGGGGSGAGGACAAGTADCNGDLSDGCEVMIDVDADHCGACDRACSTDGTDAVACSGGVCTSTCAAGAANCSQPAAPSADDGCETTLGSDTACAACGHDCEGGTCSAGACTPFEASSDFGQVTAMALDDAFLYWTNAGNLSVESLPLAGGGVNSLQNNAGGAVDIALDGTHVYWCAGTSNIVARVPKAGGAVDVLGSQDAIHLDVGATDVFIVSQGEVFERPIAGGSAMSIFDAGAQDVVADGSDVYITDSFAQAVYYYDGTNAPTVVYQLGGNDLAGPLAIDDTYVFFGGANGNGRVWRGQRGGSLFTELANIPGDVRGITANSTHVFVSDGFGGKVWRVPIEGGTAEEMAAGYDDVEAIAANDDAVFFAQSTTGAIQKLVLPPAN